MKKNLSCLFYILILIQLTTSCTEPYALQTNSFESLIVVEATLTNELKTQEIKLSRTYRLEQLVPEKETGAEIYITNNNGNRYDFVETDGKYFSTTPFQAIFGVNYTLFINTNDGNRYISNIEKLTTPNTIESITTNVAIKEGVRGVQIAINSRDISNSSKYYRYTYEETSKVIVPKWNALDSFLSLTAPLIFDKYRQIDFILKNYESKTCYSSKYSTDIILTNTLSSNEDRVANFPVRFISDKDYTIAERYSINIKQYVQNQFSYKFYDNLKKLSSSGSLLSQFQPGSLVGNLKSIINPNEKVIGFFEVSSVSEKRIFFNFDDLFLNQIKPPFLYTCTEYIYESDDFLDADADGDFVEGVELRKVINAKSRLYYNSDGNIFYMVDPFCGDCRVFSSNIKPAFWID